MTLNQLLAYINERIKPNDNREISAAKHREVLYALIDYINDSVSNSDSGIDPDNFVTITGDQEITGTKLFSVLNALRVGAGNNYLTFGASQFAAGIGKILMGNITNDRTWSFPDRTGDIALTDQLVELSANENKIFWRFFGTTEWTVLFDLSIFLTSADLFLVKNNHEPLISSHAPDPPHANIYIGDDHVYYHINGLWKRAALHAF